MPLELVVSNGKRGRFTDSAERRPFDVDGRPYIDDEDDELGLTALVRRFEEAEESSYEARQLAERDRKYVDNDQLTADQIKELEKRGQPAVIINRIKRKIDFLVGLEKQQRTRPRALPRTPKHEQDAEACTDALTYVIDDTDFKMVRSAVWRNMLVEGIGAVEVRVKGYDDSYAGDANEICIEITRFRWDRFFHDPHSLDLDFMDATYFGGVWWMDYEDALARWPDKQEELDATVVSTTYSDTFDDKPTYQVWADRKRKRIRVVQMWIKQQGGKSADQWHFAEFTKGGILLQGKSPYVTDDGDSDCGMIAQAAYCDLEGNRYGAVREMISPQDEINKRRSKSLHLLNSNQVMYEEGIVDDIEKTRAEAARPDGTIKVAPGGLAEQRFQFRERTDLAEGHIKLLQEAKAEIDLMGPNAAMQGEQGDGTASGRAIMASQQGGMIEMGDLLDGLRYFDKRVYRMVWNRIRQYWTGQKWIRITDDERNIRFAAINKPATVQVPLPTGEQIELPDIDPATGQQRIENNLAQAMVDIYIDDVSDVVAPQIEQWQALVELKKVDVNNELSFEDLIQAAPNIRNKDQILDRMRERKEQAAQQQQAPTPEEQALQIKQQEMQMMAQVKAQDSQQKLVHGQQEHQQKLTQKAQEHQLEMQLTERKAEVDERVEIRKAQLQAETQARMAEQKQQHDLVGKAREQEVLGHYENERQRAALTHDNMRETIKHRAAEASGTQKLQSSQAADAQKQESAQASDQQKLQAAKDAAKAKASDAKTSDDGGAVAKLERQLATLAKSMAALQDTLEANNDTTQQHRAIVAKELQRVREARNQGLRK
jgi:hypothetical protein